MKKPDFGHCSLEGDYSVEKPRLRIADGGRLMEIHFARSEASEWNAEMFGSRFGGVRAKCRGFSYQSRKRMMAKMNTVSCAAPLPAFVTLTFPDVVVGQFVGQGLGVFAKYAKREVDSFFKRLLRVVPTASAFWRLEWQSRKSGEFEGKLVPHFHLMIWGLESRPVPGRCDDRLEHFVPVKDKQLQFNLLHLMDNFIEASAAKAEKILAESDAMWVTGTQLSDGRYVKCCVKPRFTVRHTNQCITAEGKFSQVFEPSCMSFQDWVSMVWYHIVDSHDINHFTAGARVERVRTWGGVVSYAAKYLTKTDSEFLSEVPFGRSWGVFNRAAMPWAKIIELDLENEVGVRLRRVARRYLEHKLGRKWNAPYGITLFCDGRQFLRLIPPPPPPW